MLFFLLFMYVCLLLFVCMNGCEQESQKRKLAPLELKFQVFAEFPTCKMELGSEFMIAYEVLLITEPSFSNPSFKICFVCLFCFIEGASQAGLPCMI